MEEKKINCPVCGQEFDSPQEHEAHHNAAHPGQPMPEKDLGDSTEANF